MKVQNIDHVAITVSDVPRSIEWYTRTLGMEHRPVVEWGDYPQMVCAGDTCLALFPSSGSATPMSDDDRSRRFTMRHFAFAVNRENFELAQKEFAEQGIEFEFADHGVCHSLYISDPDGHRVEITTWEI
jgi:catechol 2,3-dioxygenase-like lactoylglutathione lyase family enzyme